MPACLYDSMFAIQKDSMAERKIECFETVLFLCNSRIGFFGRESGRECLPHRSGIPKRVTNAGLGYLLNLHQTTATAAAVFVAAAFHRR